MLRISTLLVVFSWISGVMDPPKCPLCENGAHEIEGSSKLTAKGCIGINEASKKRNDSISVSPGQFVHKECRRLYVNPCQIQKHLAANADNVVVEDAPLLRSKESFKFSQHCLFCGQPAKISDKKRGYDVFPVRTNDFQSNILQSCSEREDEWAARVRGRLQSVNDLHAADAVYHQKCSVNFRTYKNVPKAFSPPSVKLDNSYGKGRPSIQTENFLKVISYLEEPNDEPVTLLELVEKMEEFSGMERYTDRHLKRKLKAHYGEDVIFTPQHQKSDIVTTREAISPILKQFHERPRYQDDESEKLAIIKTASKLIRSDIMSMEFKSAMYPSSSDIESEEFNLQYLPKSLQYFLRNTIQSGKSESEKGLKVAAIGQAITQVTRPRFLLAPLQLGLGVQLHHQLGSKFLIDTLNALGFCVSYSEVQRFESSAACTHGIDIQGFQIGDFIQYTADNVDHNSCTIDGKGTFHGMGIIACKTPSTDTRTVIPRINPTSDEVITRGKIHIKHYLPQSNNFATCNFTELQLSRVIDNVQIFDILPSMLWTLRSPMPSWSGIMQLCSTGGYPGKSSVTFLPMIDMSASDLSCIYSTMAFVASHSKRYGTTPILTFDQPLFWKASVIQSNECSESDIQSIVLRLGGFHTEMNFLGCIGHIMRGSGLQELIETVYAPNAVCHMLSGKAVSRAVRAHGLVETALYSTMVSNALGVALDGDTMDSDNLPTDNQHPPSNHDLLENIAQLLDLAIANKLSVETLCNHQHVKKIHDILHKEKQKYTESRTGKLWIEYLNMIALLKLFIRAERSGNWKLHLQALNDMMLFFTAAGHNLYAKSAYLYLMKMQKLEEERPNVYSMFMEGHHVLRRSDRFWAGLSSDLIIEQVLMRSLKTSGGLTRGRGMTELQRSKWLQSMPVCAEVNNSMQNLTEVGYHTNDQHKDVSNTRQIRDKKDTETIIKFISERSPFSMDDMSLRNIATGAVADKSVNVDTAEAVGARILSSMPGKNISQYSFKRANQVITMDTKVAVEIEDDIIQVDPQLLFQRLITVASHDVDGMSGIFKFELCSVPSSLFDSTGFPREANKPQIAESIWKMGKCGVSELPVCEPVFVLDGGSLLQRIPWTNGDSFANICNLYVQYIKRRYTEALLVFDGYQGSSTKDITHVRRSKGKLSQRILFSRQMPCNSKKENFLSNEENKKDFITLLREELQNSGYKSLQADSDADRLIVETAVDFATNRNVVVIGEDTDLLILLLFHADIKNKDIFYKSENSRNTSKIWHILKAKSELGPTLCKCLPVIHALTGCDTTSRLHGIGKGVALKKVASNKTMISALNVFLEGNPPQDNILRTGEDVLVFLYGGDTGENLDGLRFRRFVQKTATSTTSLQIKSLPPTSDAAHFFLKRVYLQIQDWVSNDKPLNPEDWGWTREQNKLRPIRCSLPPAPENILKVIRCNCKQGCESKRCSCRRHGLDCSIACGDCKGVSCANSGTVDIETDDISYNE